MMQEMRAPNRRPSGPLGGGPDSGPALANPRGKVSGLEVRKYVFPS